MSSRRASKAFLAVLLSAVGGSLLVAQLASAQRPGKRSRAVPGTAGDPARRPPKPEDQPPFRFDPPPDPELERLRTEALTPTKSPLGDVRWVLEEIDADLPDPTPVRKGGPKLRPRPRKKKPAAARAPAGKRGKAAAKKPGATPAAGSASDEPDWVAKLRALQLADPALAAARDEAIQRVELIRKIGARPGSRAVATLLEIGFAHDGVFRDECGRNIRRMGGQALPELIRQSKLNRNWKVRRYAGYQLDRLDRAVPAKALAQRDDRLRAEIVHAYGLSRHELAVRAVLAQTDTDSVLVRETARWAFRRFLTGRPRVKKRKLKLVGGKESKKEHKWLTYRDIATIAVKETLAQEKGETVDAKAIAADRRPALDVMKELFARYDQRRLTRWDGTFAEGEKKLKAGDAAAAAAAFDKILGADPRYSKRHLMAPAYLALAEKATGEERTRLLRKARLLDPTGSAGQKARDALASTPTTLGVSSGAPLTQPAPRAWLEMAGVYGLGALVFGLLVLSGLGLLRRRG